MTMHRNRSPLCYIRSCGRSIVASLTILAAVLSGHCADADSSRMEVIRPVMSAYTFEAGGTHLADTYLTPLIYGGYSLALQYERWQAMKFSPERWVMNLTVRGTWDDADSPARNNSMWYAGVDARWSMMHRWQLPWGITVGAGGSTGIMAGCMYNGRNSNNPASAKVSWTVDAAAYASWKTRIGRLPITVTYKLTLPLTGVFYGVEYGQLYYEYWLGNHKNTIHWGHWGNYFAMDNQLTADLHFGATSLRVGYRGYVYSTKVNGITSRITSNTFIIGISGEWMSLNPRKPISADNVRIISAL